MKKIISLLLISTCAAWGGVQSVGKGGGYGEMQMILAHQQVPFLIQPCLQDNALCELSAVEISTLMASIPGSFTLNIDPTCNVKFLSVLSKDEATVSACDLYQQQNPSPISKSFAEVASLALTARVMARTDMAKTDALVLSQRLFASLRQSEQKLSIALSAGNFTSSISKIQFLNQERVYFSIEGKKITLDITPTITKSFPCVLDGNPDFRLLKLEAVSANAAIADAKVAWSCSSGEAWGGILQIYFEAGQEVLETSVQARIVGRFPL